MKALPRAVLSTLHRLRQGKKHYITVKVIKGHFYAYEATSKHDRVRKKQVGLANYLGRITDEGMFIAAVKRTQPMDLSAPLSSLRPAYSALVETHQTTQTSAEYPVKQRKLDDKDKAILTALSMNGRITMSVLGRMVGLKESTTTYRVRKLEKTFGIKYITEIAPEKLGYQSVLMTAKFIDEKPSGRELKQAFESEPLIQLAVQTSGSYDLLAYALVRNNDDVINLTTRLRLGLARYGAEWSTGYIEDTYGTVPLRGAFIEMMKDRMLQREYALMKELNENGRCEFSEIDKKYGFDAGRSQYSYHKLKEDGTLRRVTMTMRNLPVRYVAAIFANIIYEEKLRKHREELLMSVKEEPNTPISKYLLVEDSETPNGAVFYLPVFEYDDLDRTVENISSLNLGMRIAALTITSILVGDFCYRRFDNAYSLQQSVLEKRYGHAPLERRNYEETGRIRKKKAYRKTDIRGLPKEETI